MRRPLALSAVALAALTAVWAAPSSGRPEAVRFQVLANVSLAGGNTGDIYAYGNYAYLSSWRGSNCPSQGVRVFDISDPRAPRRVATFADAVERPLAGTWSEKTIVHTVDLPTFKGDLAVTSFQVCHTGGLPGFGVYDVSNPAQPKQLALFRTGNRGSHEIWFQPRGKRAYVYTAIPFSELQSSPDYNVQQNSATTPGEADFRIYDITDPRRPVKVGEWGAWRALGMYPTRGLGRRYPGNYVHSVIVNKAATRAFLSYWDLGTVILDISRPSQPRYLGRTNLGRDVEGDAHSAALGRNGKLLVETLEHDNSRPYFYDISNPRRPRLLSAFRPPGDQPMDANPYYTSGVHDPKVRGNLAYFSWYRRGLVLADISNLKKPRFLARFVPPPAADPGALTCREEPSCTMVWGVFPHRDFVLVSDMMSGLWVLRVQGLPRR